MPTLQETLLAPDTRPHVIADCEVLVDREVADMSGVTGTAVRLAYKTVRTFDAGHIPAMIESILPNVAGALQPDPRRRPPRHQATGWLTRTFP